MAHSPGHHCATTPIAFDKANARAIADHIDRFAQVTAPGPGVTRLAFSQMERQAHEIFREYMESLGLEVVTDAIGNTIATLRPLLGHDDITAPAVGTGSHLDSVPEGGRYDGIAGVVAAMEVARLASSSPIRRRRPWKFVAFAGEEGARFGQACTGSRVVAGLTSARDLAGLVDADGVSLADALWEIGLDPGNVESAVWRPGEWAGFVELHIEQGNILDQRELAVGVVEIISGSTRLRVHIRGRASHTGGTPMFARQDPLVTAARCVLRGDELARDPEHHGTRVTVGDFHVLPSSITTIPGEVIFTVDIRDIDSSRQREAAERLSIVYRNLAAENSTTVEVTCIGDTSPVHLPRTIVEEISLAARELAEDSILLASGASHDAQQISHVVPTGMIFVPSVRGLSHVPEEFTSAEHIARGTDVLLESLRRMDARP